MIATRQAWLEHDEAASDSLSALDGIGEIIRLQRQLDECRVTVVTSPTSKHIDTIFLGRTTAAKKAEILRLLDAKRRIALDMLIRGSRRNRKRALTAGLSAIVETEKVRNTGAAGQHIIDEIGKHVGEFLSQAKVVSGRPKCITSSALIEALKAIIYGLIASGIYEFVKFYSGLEPYTFDRSRKQMLKLAREYMRERDVLKILGAQGLGSNMSRLTADVLLELFESEVVFDRAISPSEILRDHVQTLRRELDRIESKGVDLSLERLILQDVEGFLHGVNWVEVSWHYATNLGFTMPEGFDLANFTQTQAFAYVNDVLRAVSKVKLVEDVIHEPNRRPKIYEEQHWASLDVVQEHASSHQKKGERTESMEDLV
jgi:hypothetical protein